MNDIRIVEPKVVKERSRGTWGAKLSRLDWLWTIAVALLWNSSLSLLLGITFNDPVTGFVSGLSFILACTISVFLWPPATPKWRTVAWAWLLSTTLAFIPSVLTMSISVSYGLIVVPTALFVFLRCNRNFARLKGRN